MVTILDTPVVELLHNTGTDLDICKAAWVSTNKEIHEGESNLDKQSGLLKYLMEHRHGSPFEHASMTFYVSAPIFVFREFHRHRIGFSYNEMSGRYTELPSEFYVPHMGRPLINYGTSARPEYRKPITQEEHLAQYEAYVLMRNELIQFYKLAWSSYKELLSIGIAKEVARIVLPVGIYSRMHVTCNPRSLMHFLSLRVHDKDAKFISHPQYEIEQVAHRLESYFSELFPLTYKAYIANGRVGP